LSQRFKIPVRPDDLARWVRDSAPIINAYFRDLSNTKNNISASATATQSAATALEVGFNRVTTSTGGDNVRLPVSEGGESVIVRNDSGSTVRIWPPGGGKIDDGTTNASDTNLLFDNSARTYKAVGIDYYTVGNS